MGVKFSVKKRYVSLEWPVWVRVMVVVRVSVVIWSV